MTKRRFGVGLTISVGLIGLATVVVNPVVSSLVTVAVLITIAASILPKEVAPATDSVAHLTEEPMATAGPAMANSTLSTEDAMGNMTWPFPSSDAGIILRRLDEIDRKLSHSAH